MVKGQSVEPLIKAIEEIMSRNRSSLTDDDILTLKQCIETLQTFKAGEYKDLKLAAQIIETLLKFFSMANEIKDLF